MCSFGFWCVVGSGGMEDFCVAGQAEKKIQRFLYDWSNNLNL